MHSTSTKSHMFSDLQTGTSFFLLQGWLEYLFQSRLWWLLVVSLWLVVAVGGWRCVRVDSQRRLPATPFQKLRQSRNAPPTEDNHLQISSQESLHEAIFNERIVEYQSMHDGAAQALPRALQILQLSRKKFKNIKVSTMAQLRACRELCRFCNFPGKS